MRQILVALLGVLVWSQVAQAEAYPIQMDRPFRVGQKVVITASIEESISETLIRSLEEQNETTGSSASLVMRGTMTVLAVDARGAISKASITLASTELETTSTRELETEKTETEPLSEGTIITAEWVNGERQISANRGRLTPELVRLLQATVPIRGPDEPGFDDLIGTAKPQAEKDTWPVNAENIRKLLAREGVIVSRSQIRGTGAGENVPATANLLLHPDATRARTSLNLLGPRLERLKGKNFVRGDGSVTIHSAQSTKDPAQAPINQGWSWACSNRIIDAGVHKRISYERSYSTRFEPYHEPARGAPIRKRQR